MDAKSVPWVHVSKWQDYGKMLPAPNPTWASTPTNGLDLSLPLTRHNSRTQQPREKCALAKS